MPELPEVESVRRMLRPILVGHQIEQVDAADDGIVFRGLKPVQINEAVAGKTVRDIGRKGKIFWLEFDDGILLIHFGMSGWVEVVGEEGEPKFRKLMLSVNGRRVVVTDMRRLGRIWLARNADEDPHVRSLGFDSLNELPPTKKLFEIVHARKAPIKAVLLDQGTFAGVGNYLADEVLYQAGIAPKRHGAQLTEAEVGRLRSKLKTVLEKAVEVEADESRFPPDWLYHHRWGGKKGPDKIGGKEIVRETVAGRTTAWVPSVQK